MGEEDRRRFAELKELLVGRTIKNVYTDDEEGIILLLGVKGISFGGKPGNHGVDVRVSAPAEHVLAVRHGDMGFAITDPEFPDKMVEDLGEWLKAESG